MTDYEQIRLTDEHKPPSKWNPGRLARVEEIRRGKRYNPDRRERDWKRRTDDPQPPSQWNPDRLAREAEVASPDTANSVGASYLLAIRDAAVALFDVGDPNQTGDTDWWHEHVHGVAGGVIPDDTHNCWLVFIDLCLWEEEVHVEGNVETIHGDDYVLFNALCTTALYEAAHRLAWLICTTVEDRSSSVT